MNNAKLAYMLDFFIDIAHSYMILSIGAGLKQSLEYIVWFQNGKYRFGFQFSGLKVYVNESNDQNERICKLLVKARSGLYEPVVSDKVITIH